MSQEFEELELELALKGGQGNIVHDIKQAWLNERFSPEILPFSGSITQTLKLLQQRQYKLGELGEEQSQGDPGAQLRDTLLRVELHRVMFIVNSYLRTRLFKIEKFAQHMQTSWAQFEPLLSEQEQKFAQKYSKIEKEHLHSVFLKDLPDKLQHPEDERLPAPDLLRFVFCRVKEDIGSFQAEASDESQTQNMQKGDIFLIRYDIIRRLLEMGKIELL